MRLKYSTIALPILSDIPHSRRGGGTGRRARLKIVCPCDMRVRVPPPAPISA